MIFGQNLHLGESIRVYQSMRNTDLHFYASLTFCYFSAPLLSALMIFCNHYGQDHFSSIIYVWLRPIFCFIDFIICFTDFMLFHSLFIGNGIDTLQTLIYGQDRFISIIHVFCFLYFMI